PEGSLLLASRDMQPHLGRFDAEAFSYRWTHADAAMDDLQRALASEVAHWTRETIGAEESFRRLRALADPSWRPEMLRSRRAGPVPRLTEDWFC
ncbi:MAG TPA: CUAEP/CCAEP-tail radical SAM protein, partial [Candidatus Krumholzibacteria bacterium]|nr:CUAEP/CCAEP-tail radical SAM protein [Candidatus Krumholzibacteria bacterium]